MLADTLFSLLAGFGLDLAWVQDELILHDNSHVSNSQLGLVRLDQA